MLWILPLVGSRTHLRHILQEEGRGGERDTKEAGLMRNRIRGIGRIRWRGGPTAVMLGASVSKDSKLNRLKRRAESREFVTEYGACGVCASFVILTIKVQTLQEVPTRTH